MARGERRREVGRASVESDGHVYSILVYQTTWDEWDDPEGRIDERFAVFAPDDTPPPAGWLETDETGQTLRGASDGIGRTVHDGGGQLKRHMEALAERKEQQKREKAARRKKVTPETPRVEYLRHECGHTGDAHEFEEPAYECSRCGQTLIGEDGRRCPTDNIFTAKVAERSCPSCEEAIEDGEELETVVGVEVDGHFVPEEEIKDASV